MNSHDCLMDRSDYLMEFHVVLFIAVINVIPRRLRNSQDYLMEYYVM